MRNLTYDCLYKIGYRETLSGDLDLCVIRFKGKHHLKVNLKPANIILVDKYLNYIANSGE